MFSFQLAERAFVESDDSADVALEPGMKKMATSPSGTNTAMTEWNRRMPMYSRPTSNPSMAVGTMLVTSPATSSGVASRNKRFRRRLRSDNATGTHMTITIIRKKPNENGRAKVLMDRRKPPLKRSTEL